MTKPANKTKRALEKLLAAYERALDDYEDDPSYENNINIEYTRDKYINYGFDKPEIPQNNINKIIELCNYL